MPFKITDVKIALFPNNKAITTALGGFRLTVSDIEDQLRHFVCEAPKRSYEGYQTVLAKKLETHLERGFPKNGVLRLVGKNYSARLNERADLVIGWNAQEKRIYFEIEFRPNVEKDLVKFQIGFNSSRLAVAVLILAVDRTAINPNYTTMPEFQKFVRVIEEFQPIYPLILTGIDGEYID